MDSKPERVAVHGTVLFPCNVLGQIMSKMRISPLTRFRKFHLGVPVTFMRFSLRDIMFITTIIAILYCWYLDHTNLRRLVANEDYVLMYGADVEVIHTVEFWKRKRQTILHDPSTLDSYFESNLVNRALYVWQWNNTIDARFGVGSSYKRIKEIAGALECRNSNELIMRMERAFDDGDTESNLLVAPELFDSSSPAYRNLRAYLVDAFNHDLEGDRFDR